METSRLDQPDVPTVTRRLTAALERLDAPLFAVMDGALFDDLPNELLRAGITARSLFLDHADPDVERAGPWLVALPGAAARSHVEGLAAAQPCAVFWACPQGDMALWRHLRKLNRALIPLEPGTALEGPEAEEAPQDGARATEPAPPGHEAVLFRHWDPNVLGAVLPLLDAPQFARVFGPATSIVMHAPDHGGLLHAPRPDDLPPPPTGMLKLRPDQMDGLEDARVQASRQRIVTYLRRVAPDQTGELSDAQLAEMTRSYVREAEHYGVRSEAAQGRWCYLQVITAGEMGKQKGVTDFVRGKNLGHDPRASSDERVRVIMRMASAQAGQVKR